MRSKSPANRLDGMLSLFMDLVNDKMRAVAWILWAFGGLSHVSLMAAQEQYTVLPGDTFARIARSQGMTLTALLEANPDHSEALQPGDRIQVPELVAFPDLSASTAWEPMDSLLNHEIQSGDTWYALSKRYNVSLDALQEANPSRETSLQLGTFIRIPGIRAVNQSSEWERQRSELLGKARLKVDGLKKGERADSIRASLTSLDRLSGKSSEAKLEPAVIDTDTLHVLAMLPFLLPVDTVLGGDFDPKTKRLRQVALEFTHGFEWGSQLLQEAGFHVQLRLVDTEADTLGAVGWGMHDLDWADVVMGPLRRSVIDTVAELLASTGKPQWILNESLHHWKRHTHTLLVGAHREAGMRDLGRLAALNHPLDSVIVLETKGKDAALERAFLEGFREERGGSDGLILWPATSRFAEGLTTLMDTSKLNVVAIPAGASARSMMAYVQTELQLADSFPVKLYANPQSLSYEFMEWDFVDRVNWTLPSDNWMQRDDSLFQNRLSWFLEEFETEPSDYALKGCDALIETARWMMHAAADDPSSIRTRFEWQMDAELGKLRNVAWKIIEFSKGDWKDVDLPPPNASEIR